MELDSGFHDQIQNTILEHWGNQGNHHAARPVIPNPQTTVSAQFTGQRNRQRESRWNSKGTSRLTTQSRWLWQRRDLAIHLEVLELKAFELSKCEAFKIRLSGHSFLINLKVQRNICRICLKRTFRHWRGIGYFCFHLLFCLLRWCCHLRTYRV